MEIAKLNCQDSAEQLIPDDTLDGNFERENMRRENRQRHAASSGF